MHGLINVSFAPEIIKFLPLIILVGVWTVAIKGYALWHAARRNQSEWFIALLLINTLGILELIYLLYFRADAVPATPASSQA